MKSIKSLFQLVAFGISIAQFSAASTPSQTLITRAKQVRELTPAQAATGAPVRLRGVITAIIPSDGFAIQDATAGVYVSSNPSDTARCHIGDLVEVFGTTGAGFAPVVRETTMRILGKGYLPVARFFSMNEIASGQEDAQWGKMRGIVRTAAIDEPADGPVLVFTLADAKGQFRARVNLTRSAASQVDTAQWIGREVVVEGVCGSLFNDRRQFTGPIFHVPDLSRITTEGPAKEVPSSSLMLFSPDQSFGGRARVRGVVSYQVPGSALYLQSERIALHVLTTQQTAVKPGDIVEAIGFPNVGESSPVLENAIFKIVGSQAPPTAIPINVGVPSEQLDGLFVQAEGAIVASYESPEGMHFNILSGNHVFEAVFSDPGNSRENFPALNSVIKIKGIYLVQSGGPWGNAPMSFRILIPSRLDLELLSAPSWWNVAHTRAVLAGTVATLLFFVIWSTYLGRRVQKQFEIIQGRIRSGVILRERNRIARELHDSLEQDLLGINMQLDLIADRMDDDPVLVRHALTMARSMGRRSIADARRSVWDLRCHWLENGDLASAIQRALQESSQYADRVHINITGIPLKQTVTTEMNILRVAQEGVANSLKHAHASRVDVDLCYTPSSVILEVIDDGSGFELDESLFSGVGHFGLLDIRERANAIEGELTIHSKKGSGTHIRLTVPIC